MDDALRVKSDYAGYRIERAKEDLDVAIEMYEEGHFRIANNRAYYSIFHAMRFVLTFDGLTVRSIVVL